MILELDNVELYFKSKPILNSIYLRAESGHVTTIIGRNGSGKSSLLKIIFGDLKPKYKLLRLDSKVILNPLFTLGNVKYLPEHAFCPDSMKLEMAFKKFQVKWDEFKNLFPDFKPGASVKFKTLSTGEQRLIEAFIILKSPGDICLLDEPFKSLSPLVIEQVKKIILLEKQSKLILTADHTLDHWEELTDVYYELKERGIKRLRA
ncbi:ATP-binding cassette domain-containing protein [Winogradskyella aurantiaca]|uniref:ATP-binding cassette domain-containing protein n=1 Tax=Winogradskyella aurantiaca TaxID=2219558 RepID=UPI000E1DDBF3|nr:ATP-binding cassette domain-containing protein [Winogradskyella aurantiaca]